MHSACTISEFAETLQTSRQKHYKSNLLQDNDKAKSCAIMHIMANKPQNIVSRFAPSPTGYLHLGHAYAAKIVAGRVAHAGSESRMILRIEDIDTTRCKQVFTDAILEDLHWLGFQYEQPVRIQSEHLNLYDQALNKLKAMKLVYPCFCTRKDIKANALNAISHASLTDEGPRYAGTCKHLSHEERAKHITNGTEHAWRIDIDQAVKHIKSPMMWTDEIYGQQTADPHLLGDVVLARKDIGTSYHMAVVVDDAAQGITHVVRGKDLLHTTHIHILLQHLLGYPTPIYHHHGLITDDSGERLAKKRRSLSLQSLRKAGTSPKQIFAMLAEG